MIYSMSGLKITIFIGGIGVTILRKMGGVTMALLKIRMKITTNHLYVFFHHSLIIQAI